MSPEADIGLVGLAVMGQNLVLNMADHGYRVAVFNRTTEKVDAFLAGPAAGTSVAGTHSLAELAASLRRPRVAMLMVKAGEAVDATISQLVPYLEPGDVIVDGGNSNFEDSIRRERELRERGLLFVGTGISGGEEGARHGPSIMPGGNPEAWPHVREIFQGIAAKVDGGTPCCDWVGEGGAGHYVKMVHNGIEYGDMQVIAEAYDLLRTVAGLGYDELHDVFADWNRGKLDSLPRSRSRATSWPSGTTDGEPLVEKILDAAGQKGTGKWTAISSLELGVPDDASSPRRSTRESSPRWPRSGEPQPASWARRDHRPIRATASSRTSATRSTRRRSSPTRRASCSSARRRGEYGWNLNYGGIALMWRGGCIIRSAFLGRIKEAFDRDPELPNLLLDPYFRSELAAAEPGWRRQSRPLSTRPFRCPRTRPRSPSSTVTGASGSPRTSSRPSATTSARTRTSASTARADERFHTNWTGRGGETASGAYDA